MALPREFTPTLRDLASRVLKLSHLEPGHPETVEIILLLTRIQTVMSIDHGMRHARRMVPALRGWPAAEGGADPAVASAADAIARACNLAGGDLNQDGPPPVTAAVLATELTKVLGDEFTPEQLDRAAVVAWSVLELLRCAKPVEAEAH
jgi:hypothetical protein